jgi:hypothetical protein
MSGDWGDPVGKKLPYRSHRPVSGVGRADDILLVVGCSHFAPNSPLSLVRTNTHQVAGT